ncbi:MAG: pyruvate ferredoxin oxidoreductase [Patescibacteria group bacterium]|jgi:pyruvate ferredoxin oxidoreductase alpha subunit|nr:pyruvate ferredoxin oxidoreductase [Patescibacteria group bacterium]
MTKKIKKELLEGSKAVAEIVKKIKPDVISAYPITPQTHIVEDLAQMKADGEAEFEYLRAESEFAAASIVLGASAVGSRAYSATSSQGLLLMSEVIHNIAGMRLPVVITCANRAISAPISIWCDHSDVMNIRDAGFIQFFASNLQEAVNQHLLAFKIAEKMNIPAMVNIDGFILTHSYEPVHVPNKTIVNKFVSKRKLEKGDYLDPKNPLTFGAFFPPDYYMETREKLHKDLNSCLKEIKKENKLLNKLLGFGNDNGLIEYIGNKSAKTVLVALGSVNGTIEDTISKDKSVALLKVKTYRPFPKEEIRKALKNAKQIAVIEKSISFGSGGPLYLDINETLKNQNKVIKNYIVGLGGRDVSKEMIRKIIKNINIKNSKDVSFFG